MDLVPKLLSYDAFDHFSQLFKILGTDKELDVSFWYREEVHQLMAAERTASSHVNTLAFKIKKTKNL